MNIHPGNILVGELSNGFRILKFKISYLCELFEEVPKCKI
jgi:hypothetical protein